MAEKKGDDAVQVGGGKKKGKGKKNQQASVVTNNAFQIDFAAIGKFG